MNIAAVSDNSSFTREARKQAALEGEELARQGVRLNSLPQGVFDKAEGGQIVSIRLSRKCKHSLESLQNTSCGHMWCSVCRGHVDIINKVVFDSAHATITTNRKPPSEYQNYFAETFVGSHGLTDAVQKLFPKGKVRPARDMQPGGKFDLGDKLIYGRHKLDCKKRTTMYEHFSPPMRCLYPLMCVATKMIPRRWK